MPSCSWFRTNHAGRFIILSAVMRFPPLFYFSSVSFFYNICNFIILSVMFSTILEEADEETASRMVPVILERVGLLYHVKNYRKEIHEWVFFVLWAISNIVRQYSEIFFCIKPCNFLGKRVPPHPITCKAEKICVFVLAVFPRSRKLTCDIFLCNDWTLDQLWLRFTTPIKNWFI